MENYIFAGCDLHDKNMLLRIAKHSEKAVTRVFECDGDGRRAMVECLRKCAKEWGATRIIFAYEACAKGYGLYDELREEGIECYVLAPTKMASSVKSRKSKTDERDGERILEVIRGHFLAGNELPAVWVPDAGLRDDRELVRGRLDVREKCSGVRRQIRSLLKRNSVGRPRGGGKSWTGGYVRWLVEMTEARSGLKEGARVVLGSLLRQLEMLEKEVRELQEGVLRMSRTERYGEMVKALCELKGVGVLTAMVFLTEMGDLSRFKNRRDIGGYLGVVPSSDETGESGDRKGHITHQGPSRVRAVLCQAVWCRVRTDESERAWYKGVVSRNPKHKKIAVVGAMRRLAIRMWHEGLDVQAGRLRSAGASPPPVPPVGGSASLRPQREGKKENGRTCRAVVPDTPADAVRRPG